ncbi:MAG: glutathione transferase [Rhodobacterales bacterium]|nr:MAG: glutathione transferase [Rhodobacterales bacterium]
MIEGINHITLTVSDLPRSLAFYERLGLRRRMTSPRSAYLEAGSLWLCLVKGDAIPAQDYSHIALHVAPAQFDTMAQRLADLPSWQENTSPGKSLYIQDPDGHKLELHAGTLEERLGALSRDPRPDRQIT